MPPSGFSQEAINGLLTFVRSAYENTLDKYKNQDLTEETVLQKSTQYLDKLVKKSIPPSLDGTVSSEGIKGLTKFVTTNYRDLIAEIEQGKKKEGEAMLTEIRDISKYLIKFKLEEE